MNRILHILAALVTLLPATSHSQDWSGLARDDQRPRLGLLADDFPLLDDNTERVDRFQLDQPPRYIEFEFNNHVVRGQGSDETDGGGSGASAATDPSVPLTQMQFQNVFVPNTHDAGGYSNQFILQPVIPINLNSEFFPYHIVRPTLPIVAPSPDPDGPAGVQGGLGDLTVLDVYVHPMEHVKTNVGAGYVTRLPTATNSQLGLREWQLGPAVFAVTKAVPKWNLGAVVQTPLSLDSDSYSVEVQPIAVRLLPNNWYVGWGDLLWRLDDRNGNYDIPLSARLGRVVEFHQHKLNVFVEPFYTPDGLRKGPASEWGVKLNVTLLLPDVKIGPLCGSCGHSQDCSWQ